MLSLAIFCTIQVELHICEYVLTKTEEVQDVAQFTFFSADDEKVAIFSGITQSGDTCS